MKFNGNTIVVCGSTSGVGQAVIKVLQKHKTNIIAIGNNKEKLERLYLSQGINCVQVDLCKAIEVESVYKAIKNTCHKIDSLICCAGIGIFGNITDYTDHEIEECIYTNLIGQIILIKHLVKLMNESGHIVIVESIAAKKPFKYGSVYVASKFGMAGFSEALSYELRKKNIKVTSIRPGLINTGFVGDLVSKSELQYALAPNDVANAIVYALLQPDSCNISEITLRPFDRRGQDLFINALEQKFEKI